MRSITDYYITSRKIFQCQELVVLRQQNREMVNKRDSESISFIHSNKPTKAPITYNISGTLRKNSWTAWDCGRRPVDFCLACPRHTISSKKHTKMYLNQAAPPSIFGHCNYWQALHPKNLIFSFPYQRQYTNLKSLILLPNKCPT